MRVLVVDDDPDMRLLIRMRLERAGHGVVEAGDGRSAMAVAEREDVDAVLSDNGLGSVSGLVLRHSLELARPGLRVVVWSCWPRPELGVLDKVPARAVEVLGDPTPPV